MVDPPAGPAENAVPVEEDDFFSRVWRWLEEIETPFTLSTQTERDSLVPG